MKKYTTQYQKRKLLYEKKNKQQKVIHPLDLPQQFLTKISVIEHKKVKQAFYIQANIDYELTYEKFLSVMRSLGIIVKTDKFYQIFAQLQKKHISWNQFLKVYLIFRHQKGSYNQLNNALNALDKQYKGDSEMLQDDLINIGDILSAEEMRFFKQEIMGNKAINNQIMINSLLGYK